MTRPFSNTITGSNGALIRERIKSPDFVTGVSGWSINKDGSAEFNNAVFRGDIVVGGSSPPNLEMTEDIPAELVTFYATNWGGTIADFVVLMRATATDYAYQLILTNNSVVPVPVVFAEGIVTGGTVYERLISFVSAGRITTDYSDFSLSDVRMFGRNLLGDPTIAGSDMSFGVSLPRGVTLQTTLTSFTFNSTTSTTEQLALTTSTFTFKAGRAYQFRLRGFKKSAAAQAPGFNVHKTNLAGTTLIGGRVDIPLTGFDLEEIREGIFVNSTGADVNAALAVGIQPSTATIVTFETGTGGNSGWYEVVDIGASNDYLGRPTV